MVVSGTQLSLFGRSALNNIGVSRAGVRPELDPLEPTGAIRDAVSSEYREIAAFGSRDGEAMQTPHAAASEAARTGDPAVFADPAVDLNRVRLQPAAGQAGGLQEEPHGDDRAEPVAAVPVRARHALDAYRGPAAGAPPGPRASFDLIA